MEWDKGEAPHKQATTWALDGLQITTERRPSTRTLISPDLPDEIRQTRHPTHSQNYNWGCSVEVWEKPVMIWERNHENWVKPKLKIETANSYQTLPPSPTIFLFQWLSWTLPKHGGMILLKFQGKQGSFDGPFDVSRHRRNYQDV